jgi:hypothetical protein
MQTFKTVDYNLDDDPCPRCGGDHDRLDRREPCPMVEARDDEQPPYRTSGWQPAKTV